MSARQYDRVAADPRQSRERSAKSNVNGPREHAPTWNRKAYATDEDPADRATYASRKSFGSENWEDAEDSTELNAFINMPSRVVQDPYLHDLESGTTNVSTPTSVKHGVSSQVMEPASPGLYNSMTKRVGRQPNAGSTRPNAGQGMVMLHPMQAESDDYLHIPDKNPDAHSWRPTLRGLGNVFTITIIGLSVLMLFVGYPILADHQRQFNKGLASFLADAESSKIPVRGLIDEDTEEQYHTWTNPVDKSQYDLVFSDEFNKDGRTFWPGDDPFWEGGNFYYAATHDYEWYTPEAITTKDGYLLFTMDEYVERLNLFRSGMLQSWNKFCFQGGYIEGSVILPGSHDMQGFWPGFWLMGNLGRPGYLGSTDGMWPYAYEACDVGIMPYQKDTDGSPVAASRVKANGAKSYQHKNLSALPGMRFPSCTCSGQDHPGPNRKTARSAPELDIFEIQVQGDESHASQSYQVAPYDENYIWFNNKGSYKVYDSDITKRNPWSGNPYQEAMSCTTTLPHWPFFDASKRPRPIRFGVEWDPDFENTGSGHITWYMDGKPTWTLNDAALSGNENTEISRRIFPKEPMFIIMNLGISSGFQQIQWDDLEFPAHMAFDYIRVYQKHGTQKRVTCNPDNYPTADYIQRNLELYYNNNLTSYLDSSHQAWPKNSQMNQC